MTAFKATPQQLRQAPCSSDPCPYTQSPTVVPMLYPPYPVGYYGLRNGSLAFPTANGSVLPVGSTGAYVESGWIGGGFAFAEQPNQPGGVSVAGTNNGAPSVLLGPALGNQSPIAAAPNGTYSGSISQTFFVPPNATTLSFNYQVYGYLGDLCYTTIAETSDSLYKNHLYGTVSLTPVGGQGGIALNLTLADLCPRITDPFKEFLAATDASGFPAVTATNVGNYACAATGGVVPEGPLNVVSGASGLSGLSPSSFQFPALGSQFTCVPNQLPSIYLDLQTCTDLDFNPLNDPESVGGSLTYETLCDPNLATTTLMCTLPAAAPGAGLPANNDCQVRTAANSLSATLDISQFAGQDVSLAFTGLGSESWGDIAQTYSDSTVTFYQTSTWQAAPYLFQINSVSITGPSSASGGSGGM